MNTARIQISRYKNSGRADLDVERNEEHAAEGDTSIGGCRVKHGYER
jgi:hypothetical protein